MADKRTTVVDFVARGSTPDIWLMVRVEAGPWPGSVEENLRRVQERLYGCLGGAIDGQLAEKFPETKGKKIVIRLDGYDLPRMETEEFFARFSHGVLELPDYREALRKSEFVSDISFELNLKEL
jgi:hypothetical protein